MSNNSKEESSIFMTIKEKHGFKKLKTTSLDN